MSNFLISILIVFGAQNLMAADSVLSDKIFESNVISVDGGVAIQQIQDSQEFWLEGAKGDFEGEACQFEFVFEEKKDFLLVQILNEKNKGEVLDSFYFDGRLDYTHYMESHEDGFYRTDIYEIGSHMITFKNHGDSYYEISISHGEKTVSCNIDF